MWFVLQEQGELWRAIPQIFTYRDTGADLEFGLGVEESDSPFRLASPAPTAELRCVQLTACDEAADSSTAISKRARGYGSVSSKDSSGVPGVVPPRRILGTAWKARLHVYRNGSLSAWQTSLLNAEIQLASVNILSNARQHRRRA